MTTNEACEYLGISRPTLFKRIKDKQLNPLPPENPNRMREPLRFRRADVEALDKRTSPPERMTPEG